MIKRLQVRVHAGVTGEFSSPELTLCADLWILFCMYGVKIMGRSTFTSSEVGQFPGSLLQLVDIKWPNWIPQKAFFLFFHVYSI